MRDRLYIKNVINQNQFSEIYNMMLEINDTNIQRLVKLIATESVDSTAQTVARNYLKRKKATDKQIICLTHEILINPDYYTTFINHRLPQPK